MVALLFLLATALCGSAIGQTDPCDNGSCPPGSECHPFENLCYTNPAPTNKPYAWLGEAPDLCNRTAADCALFDFEYESSHPRGDAEWCQTGTKIRCVAKAALTPADPTPANQLQVMSYNIFERDFAITQDGQRERTCRIPRVLLTNWPQVDVIGIQEGFMGGCWPDTASLRMLFAYHGFRHSTRTVDSEEIPENGGVFIVSRWPIIEEDQFVFDTANDDTWDSFAGKGVSYANILKTVSGQSRVYHVMTTHYQSGGPFEFRLNQTREWASFVQQKNISQTEGVIYSGDLNVNYYSENGDLEEVVNTLQAELPTPVGTLNGTSYPKINDILNTTRTGGRESWLDYSFQSRVHLTPSTATIEALYPTADEYFPICWCEQCIPLDDYVYPDDPECELVRYVRHLSDHFPVMGTFTFP